MPVPIDISGPIPKGDDQMFEQYQPLVEKLYEVQRKQATELLAEAKQKINEGTKARIRNSLRKVSSHSSVLTRHCLRTSH